MNSAAIVCILFSCTSALRINTHKKLHYTYLSHQNDNADNGYHSAYLNHGDPKLAMRQKVDMESQLRSISQLVHKAVEKKSIMVGDFDFKAWVENSGMKEMTKIVMEDPDFLKVAEKTAKSYDASKVNSWLEKSLQVGELSQDLELSKAMGTDPDVQALTAAIDQAMERHPTESKRVHLSVVQLKTATLSPQEVFRKAQEIGAHLVEYQAEYAIAAALLAPGSPLAAVVPVIIVGNIMKGKAPLPFHDPHAMARGLQENTGLCCPDASLYPLAPCCWLLYR